MSEFRLGRLRLPTIMPPTDTLGDGLEAVGATLVAAERRPRPLELTVVLRGKATDTDQRAVGERLRRQIVGLLENPRARLEGMWISHTADPMTDSYVLIGGGELAVDNHSLVLGEYELELTDVFRVGKMATHRPARRVDVRDQRKNTAWRDYRRTIYNTDFASLPGATSAVALPVGAADLRAGGRRLVKVGDRPSRDGLIPMVLASVSGQMDPVTGVVPSGMAVDFELTAADRGKGDVTAHDPRTGSVQLAPAGDTPEIRGWEEVFGPAHPLTPATMPILSNGLARARWVPQAGDAGYLALDAAQAAGADWSELARVSLHLGFNNGRFGTLSEASVMELTPERGVVRATFVRSNSRAELYITLQRGWTAPQLELYKDGANLNAEFLISYATPVGAGWLRAHDGQAYRATDEPAGWDAADQAIPAASPTPWVRLERTDGGLAATVTLPTAGHRIDYTSTDHGLGSRPAMRVRGDGPTELEGPAYAGLRLSFGRPGRTPQAEAYRKTTAGATQTADAAASGGQAITHAQAAATGDSFEIFHTALATGGALALDRGIYSLAVRIRSTDGVGAPYVRAQIWNAGTGVRDTFTLNTVPAGTNYVWAIIPNAALSWDPAQAAPGDAGAVIRLAIYRGAGASGNPVLDRLTLVPTSRPQALDTAAQHARDHLLSALATATLVSR